MPAGTSALMSSMAHPGSMALPMDSAALLATPCPDMVGASRLSSSSYSFSDHITSCAVTFRLAPAEPRKPPDSSARRAQARRRLQGGGQSPVEGDASVGESLRKAKRASGEMRRASKRRGGVSRKPGRSARRSACSSKDPRLPVMRAAI